MKSSLRLLFAMLLTVMAGGLFAQEATPDSPPAPAEVKIAAYYQGQNGRIELLVDPGECEDLVHRDNGHVLKGNRARVVPDDPTRVGTTGCWWLTPSGVVLLEDETTDERFPIPFDSFTVGAPPASGAKPAKTNRNDV